MTKIDINSKKSTYHHGDLRQQLIDVAIQMIRDEGEAALSMRKLATALGVSRMAPYHHFVDKNALLCAIAEEGFNRFTKFIRGSLGEQSQQTNKIPVTKSDLAKFVQSYLEFAVSYPEFYDLMFGGHLWKSNKLTDSLKSSGHQSFKAYVERVKQLQIDNQIINNLTAQEFAQLSWSMLHGMSRLLIDGIYIDHSALNSMSEMATNALWLQIKD